MQGKAIIIVVVAAVAADWISCDIHGARSLWTWTIHHDAFSSSTIIVVVLVVVTKYPSQCCNATSRVVRGRRRQHRGWHTR